MSEARSVTLPSEVAALRIERSTDMLPDEHIVYDEMTRRQQKDEWQPEALRLPLYVPQEEEEAHTEESEEDSSQRGVIIIDMNDGYSIAE